MEDKKTYPSPAMHRILESMPEPRFTYVDHDSVDEFQSILVEKQKKIEQKGPFTWDFPPYPESEGFEKEDILRYFFFNVSNDHGYFHIKNNHRTGHFYGQFHGSEDRVRGSDSLYFLSTRILNQEKGPFDPEKIKNMTEKQAEKFFMDDQGNWLPRTGLESGFSREFPELIGRYSILKKNAEIIDQDYEGKVSNLLEKSSGFLLTQESDEPGLFQLLSDSPNSLGKGFPGYRDKGFYKKANLFYLMLRHRPDIKWTVEDPENQTPPIDYHWMKTGLRTGLVRIRQEFETQIINNLTNWSRAGKQVEYSIRKSTLDACLETMGKSGLDASIVDNMIFSLRKSCVEEKPLCNSCDFDALCSAYGEELSQRDFKQRTNKKMIYPVFPTETY